MNYNELEGRINNILQKIDGGYDDDKKDVLSWKREAQDAFFIKAIQESEGMVIIKKAIESEIEEINFLLVNADSEKLSDKQRDRIIDKKKMYIDFLNIFKGAEASLEEITRKVDENEEYLELKK